MFIRKKQNKSGSISFHIVRKQGRKQVLIKSLGSAKDAEAISKLEQRAQDELSGLLKQHSIDFRYEQDGNLFVKCWITYVTLKYRV